MKNLFFIILITNFCFSQNKLLKNYELDSLIKQSINSRYDLILSSGYKYFEINEFTEKISTEFDNSNIKFKNNKELFKISIKSKKELILYKIEPKFISNDTIDINFGEVFFKAKRGIYFKPKLHFKKIFLSVGCRGVKYIPDMRFIYNKETLTWEMKENIFLNY